MMIVELFKSLTRKIGQLVVLMTVLTIPIIFSPETVLAAPDCVVPNTGNWTVNSDCDLARNSTARADVIVRNSSTLRIPDNTSLSLDFTNSRLRIAEDSKVVIEPEGKIDTSTHTGTNPGNGSTSGTFPPLPSYIDLSSNNRLIVDFGRNIEPGFRITIPTRFLPEFLPNLPPDDSEVILPDNFCGLRVIQADRFIWLDQQGNLIDDDLFNSVPEDSSVQELFGSEAFLGGIDFSGPIGACEGQQVNWRFPGPLSKTDEGMTAPERDLRLVFELVDTNASIEFLEGEVGPNIEPLDASELFSDEVFEQFENIVEDLLSGLNEPDSGYCSIDQYVQKVCEESEEKCPVGDDFESPC